MEIDANRRSVEELFLGGFQLAVPPYQRPYAWTADEIDQLWDDILDAGPEGYFLGPLVIFKDREGQKRDVIDGQQRLTTLLMLLALIRDRYAEIGSPHAEDPRSVIFASGFKVGDERFRLTTGRANWRVFRDFILLDPDSPDRRHFAVKKEWNKVPRSERTRNKALVDAHRKLAGHIDSYLGENPGEPGLRILGERIATKVDMVAIEVTGLADAFLLFETLNDRGLRLSAADLLKSHLLRRFDEQVGNDLKLEEASREWDGLVDALGGGDMTRFLRHFLLGSNKKVRKADIFPLFQQETKVIGPQKLLSNLREMGDIYSQFLRPDEADPSLRPLLRDVQDTGVLTQYVALLPAFKWLAQADFEAFARLSEIIAFRWSVCGLNAQQLESLYQLAAETLNRSSGSELEAARSTLSDALPPDDFFMDRFLLQRLGTRQLARYALHKIEKALRSRSELQIKASSEVHVEHVMPITATDFWLSKVPNPEEYQDVVARWGNLTLLHKTPNEQIQNGPWDVKRTHYEDSDILMTQALAAIPSWDAREVALRHAWMAKCASLVWGLDPQAPKRLPTLDEVRSDPKSFGFGNVLLPDPQDDVADDRMESGS